MVAAWMRLEYAMLANSKLSQSRTILTSAIEKYLKDAKIKQDKLLKQLNAAYKRDNTKKKGNGKKIKDDKVDENEILKLHSAFDARGVGRSSTKPKKSLKGKNEGTQKKEPGFWTNLRDILLKNPKDYKRVDKYSGSYEKETAYNLA